MSEPFRRKALVRYLLPKDLLSHPLYSVSSIDAQVLESSPESRLLSPIRRLI